MRSICPHCNTALSVADDKLTSGWSYLKCYKCAGFSMIRKQNIQLIKMAGQPSAPSHLSSPSLPPPPKNLAKKSSKIFQKISELEIKQPPAVEMVAASEPVATSAPAEPIAPKIIASPPPPPPPSLIKKDLESIDLDDFLIRDSDAPLPVFNHPHKQPTQRYLPFAMGIAGILAIGSGVYLYIQGQMLWERAMSSNKPPISKSLPASVAHAQKPALGITIASPADDVIQAAEISDEVKTKAMAPAHNSVAQPQLRIQVKVNDAILRAGPGTEYPAVARAMRDSEFAVQSWQDRWFKIQIPSEKGSTSPQTVWIRNDLVIRK